MSSKKTVTIRRVRYKDIPKRYLMEILHEANISIPSGCVTKQQLDELATRHDVFRPTVINFGSWKRSMDKHMQHRSLGDSSSSSSSRNGKFLKACHNSMNSAYPDGIYCANTIMALPHGWWLSSSYDI
jgi:hypothetical protein